MYSTPIPWKILSSTVGVGILTPDWDLDAEVGEPDEARSFRVAITFASPFTTPPVVQLGLTGFDIDQRDSPRLTLSATQITADGFEAVISSWATTRVYAVEFNWVAIGG